MVGAGLLDEDQTTLHDDGHGQFRFVLTRRGVEEFLALAGRYFEGNEEPYGVWLSGLVSAKTPAELADKVVQILKLNGSNNHG
jgi:hypothetical protein